MALIDQAIVRIQFVLTNSIIIKSFWPLERRLCLGTLIKKVISQMIARIEEAIINPKLFR